MRILVALKILSILLMAFSLSMLPPLGIAIGYHDGGIWTFVVAFMITFFFGFLLWLPLRNYQHELKNRDGFLIVALCWVVLPLFGSIPFDLNLFPKISLIDAVFESVSGLTTTGGSVLSHLADMPHSILYYRQQLHFLGGMGIIVLAVAILPMLGIGGMQLYRAETVGPIKMNKLRPRIAQTAKSLWTIYVLLVACCCGCFMLAGMGVFDAVGESFSIVSTGGFTIHDSSFAYYHSPLIDGIATIFMILGATNFSLHFQFLRTRRPNVYYRDAEFRAYLIILAIVSVVIILTLLANQSHYRHANTVLTVLLTVVSMGSTTGITTDHFNHWPTFLPYLLMLLCMLGGCGGSTAGGIKIMRCLLLKAQAKRELKRLVHPQAVDRLKLGDSILPEAVVQGIWGFVAVFITLFFILLLLLLATGLDIKTAFGSAAACLSNSGASIGGTAINFHHIPFLSKVFLIIAMIAGRLEIFTLLVLLTPSYWRK